MSIFSEALLFALCWSVSLLALLPIGVRSQRESGHVVEGTEPGAPVDAEMKSKFLVSVAAAAVAWLILFGLRSLPVPWLDLLPPPFGGSEIAL